MSRSATVRRRGVAAAGAWSTDALLVGVPVLVGALAPLALGSSGYLVGLATSLLVLVGYATGLQVVFAGTGQLFLCLGALAGGSGYAAVVLVDDLGWPVLAGVAAGTLLAAAVGAGLSWVCVRRDLEGIAVGIVTLAASLAFTTVAVAARDLTGGETGRVVAGEGWPAGPLGSYYVLLAAVTLVLAGARVLARSRLGWACQAVRDDPVAAALAGVDVTRTKVAGAAVGSAMVGLTGALYAFHEAFVSPTAFAFAHVDVRALVVLALGGFGSPLGPVVGAVVVAVLDELLRPLGQLRLSVYGAVLVVLVLAARRGLVPTITDLLHRRAPRPTSRS